MTTRPEKRKVLESPRDAASVQQWFASHVTLDGHPYTLDSDQAAAVADLHLNTLVTARAGSGKTRVIVAKVAYLVAHHFAELDEIAIFMFNRTAAAEVNQRIADVKVDGISLVHFQGHPTNSEQHDVDAKVDGAGLTYFRDHPQRHERGQGAAHPRRRAETTPGRESIGKTDIPTIASTFHKFAYDLVKLADGQPQLLGESEHDLLIRRLLREHLTTADKRVSRKMYAELLSIVGSFIARAGQKYPGVSGLASLETAVSDYCSQHSHDSDYRHNINLHRLSLKIYQDYLKSLQYPTTDFNLLMARATAIMQHADQYHSNSAVIARLHQISHFKFIMIDEYQDFSYLFYALVQAIRSLAPTAKLFAVGDDWQAINRFAGSDVNYFINFADYFPDDQINIPLATNYRSCRRIVENANCYMLKHYDPDAIPAIPFQRHQGKIIYRNPSKTRFDFSDIQEDGLGDGQYYAILDQTCPDATQKSLGSAARHLKTIVKIIARHPHEDYLLLHRHNFTSFEGVSLAGFITALRRALLEQGIMTADDFTTHIRGMTMHKSKGLESTNVILLEMDANVIASHHPHATIFEIFGDTLAAETADRQRLLYVALTRAKRRLYILTHDPQVLL